MAWMQPNEWDDYRTAGGAVILSAEPYRLELGYYLLTRRSPDGVLPGLRTDELILRASRGFPLTSDGSVELLLRPYLQIGSYGRYGGLTLQQGFHEATGVQRPVPEQYSSPAAEGAAGAELEGRLPLGPPGLFLTADTGAALRSSATAMLEAGGGLHMARESFSMEVEAGWREEWGQGPLAPLETVRRMSSGPYLSFRSGTPPLSITRSSYLASGRGEGTFSVSISPGSAAQQQSSSAPLASLTATGTHPAATRYQQLSLVYPLRIRLTSQTEMLLGGGYMWTSGWVEYFPEREIERNNGVWIPLEAALQLRVPLRSLPDLDIEPYALLAPGAQWYRTFAEDGARAEALRRSTFLAARAGAGLRIGLRTRGAAVLGIAAEAVLTARTGLGSVESSRVSTMEPGLYLLFYAAQR
jgi:hypothetical protein